MPTIMARLVCRSPHYISHNGVCTQYSEFVNGFQDLWAGVSKADLKALVDASMNAISFESTECILPS